MGQSIQPSPAEPAHCSTTILANFTVPAPCALQALPEAPVAAESGIDLSRIHADPSLFRRDPTTQFPRAFNTQFVVDHAISYAALVFDAEAEVRFERQGGAESNPLLGSHPGRLRIYGTIVPIQTALLLWDWLAKRDALATPREIGEDSSVHFPTWRFIPYMVTMAHIAGGVVALTESPH